MAFTNQDLIVLGVEFDTDPAGLGYPPGGVGNDSNDAVLSDAINEVRPEILVLKTFVSPGDISGVIPAAEYSALGDDPWIRDCVLSLHSINPAKSPQIVTGLRERFSIGTIARSAIELVLHTPGSRLTQMRQDGLIDNQDDYFSPSTPSLIRAARAAQ